VAAIKKKATSVGAVTQAPQLMNALQANFRTDMDLTDLKAVYDFAGKVPDTGIQHFAVTDQDLGIGYLPPRTTGSCGPRNAYAFCPLDPSYQTWQAVFSHLFVPKPTLAEQAPVQLVNASRSFADLQTPMTNVVRPMGFQVADGARHVPSAPKTVIYDYSGGKYPATAAWLQDFFGAQVEPGTAPTAGVRGGYVPAAGEKTDGLVVVMGSDFAARFYGVG